MGGAVAVRAAAGNTSAESYDIALDAQPGSNSSEFLCRVSLRSGETGRIHEVEGSFKRGATGTLRTGEGRPDGSAIDLIVDVTADASGQRIEFLARVSDRGKLVTTQRTSVSLGKA